MTIVGGLLLASTYVVDVPMFVVALGTALFGAGVLFVLVATTLDARTTGRSWLASLAAGVRVAFRWLVEMMP